MTRTQQVVQPGSTIGVFGSGQLGRMFTQVAKRMGYRVVIFSGDQDSPAGQVADQELVHDYDDRAAIEAFAKACDVITLEFENIPETTVEWASQFTPVYPGAGVLSVAQDRIVEKQTLTDSGLPVTPFHPVLCKADLDNAIERFGLPIVLKTARSGYDGKGQRILRVADDVPVMLRELNPSLAGGAEATLESDRLIAERMIDFQREVSILVYRNETYGCGTYPIIENEHANHILDVSVCPSESSSPALEQRAAEIAVTAAERLGLIGIMCIEFFVTEDDSLLINEIAPRPHNSGHLTIEAFPCCQFEQQLRCVCGLPHGDTRQIAPAAMTNLLGDVWQDGMPRFDQAMLEPNANLHLYGKQHAKPGRKMGHITATSSRIEDARRKAIEARIAIQNASVEV